MTELEQAEKFCAELDALIAGKPAGHEPELRLAEKFLCADFSGESKIRRTLRARLLAPAAERRFFRLVWIPAFAAACAVVVCLQFWRPDKPAPQGPEAAAAPLPPPLRVTFAGENARAASSVMKELFVSVPLNEKAFNCSCGGENVIVSVKCEKPAPETGNPAGAIEVRQITPEDLFETKII